MKSKKKTAEKLENHEEKQDNEDKGRKTGTPGPRTPGGISLNLLTPCRRMGLTRKRPPLKDSNKSFAAKIIEDTEKSETITEETIIKEEIPTKKAKTLRNKKSMSTNTSLKCIIIERDKEETKTNEIEDSKAASKPEELINVDEKEAQEEKKEPTDVGIPKIILKKNSKLSGDKYSIKTGNLIPENEAPIENAPKELENQVKVKKLSDCKIAITEKDSSILEKQYSEVYSPQSSISEVTEVRESLSDRVKSRRRTRTKTYEDPDSDFDEKPLTKSKTLPISTVSNIDEDEILPYNSPKRSKKMKPSSKLKSKVKSSAATSSKSSFEIIAEIHSPPAAEESPIRTKEGMSNLVHSTILTTPKIENVAATPSESEVVIAAIYKNDSDLPSSQEDKKSGSSSFKSKLKLKKVISASAVEELKARISGKEKQLQTLKKEGLRCDDLEKQILDWRTCCRRALEELLHAGKERSEFEKNFNMGDLLKMMCIPYELVQYDPEKQDFEDDS